MEKLPLRNPPCVLHLPFSLGINAFFCPLVKPLGQGTFRAEAAAPADSHCEAAELMDCSLP